MDINTVLLIFFSRRWFGAMKILASDVFLSYLKIDHYRSSLDGG